MQSIVGAKMSLPAWCSTPVAKGAQVMFRFKPLLEEDSDEICSLFTSEHGKVISDTVGELARSIENAGYACGAVRFNTRRKVITQKWPASRFALNTQFSFEYH
ncbi:aldehyde dehydrogenase family protein [Shewanella sp. VB17]|uniref:aldehyde dehydrogenase family protein n=1 Tax=Shewanella sp. VB17 TaxID=2739432 RepID=UPI00156399CA|nr:aldehyde dehydrogenase family protein [Shewanella sp. VB17]NRD74354.1 aldehyde dehydrogenase family protein [Shewanella sp. VB17]